MGVNAVAPAPEGQQSGGIARSDVMWRTNHIWAEGSVPYSMSGYHSPDGYRTDCSGYTSMCWNSGTPGGSTVTLVSDGLIYEVRENDLIAGDAVGHCGPNTGGAYGHIQLWEGWDPAGDGHWVWEQAGGTWGPQRNFYAGPPSWYGYRGWRYVNIQEDGMSERDAQLSASWTTTGSDSTGWVEGPEAWSIRNYANRQVEERITALLNDITNKLNALTQRVDDMAEGRPPRPPRPEPQTPNHPPHHPHPNPDNEDIVVALRELARLIGALIIRVTGR